MRTLKCSVCPLSVLLAVILASCAVWSAPVAGCYGGWQASWSPDGKQLAFVSGLPHSSSNIWIVGADGAGARQLTTRGGSYPIWSPDGRMVIFQSDRGQGMRYYSRSVNGANDDVLFERLPSGASDAAWSPDGKKIVYSLTAEGKQQTYVVDLATGDKRGLKYEMAAREYCWSPDGKRLAVVTGQIIGDSLLEYDLATDKLQHVYHGYCSSPAYSPDGAVLAFAAPIGKNRHKLLAVVPSTKAEKKFTVTEFDGKSLVWSRNGKKLLFASSTYRQLARLWTVASDGGKPKQFKTAYKWAGKPRYSPSGEFILFEAVAKYGYGSDLYVCRADGSGERRLTTSGLSYWQPRWLNTGKFVVLTDAESRGQILMVDPNSGVATPGGAFALGKTCRTLCSPDGAQLALVQEGQVAVVQLGAKTAEAKLLANSLYPPTIAWAPDAKRVYYTDAKGKGLGVFAVDIDGKNRAGLTPATGAATETTSVDICPAVSPDGKTIAFVRGTDIWTVGANGANERLLAKTDLGANDAVSYPSWSSDGGLVLFQVQRIIPDGVSFELWTVKSDGTDEKRVYQRPVNTQFDVYNYDSTNPAQLTPDGKSAVVTFAGPSGLPDLWLIDLASGQAKQLTQTGGTFPSLSCDGKTIAYTNLTGGREGISILDVATLKSRDLNLK